MQLIPELQKFVKDELEQVDSLILDHVRSANEALVSEVASYLMNSGGKRIRPILTLLSSKLFGYQHGNSQILLAAAVEFIHAATLLHDDVIDGSALRRSKPTANNIWGNKTSILVGDYLFSQSFKLMVETQEMAALESLSSASALIVEGELSQLVVLKENSICSVDKYMQIITYKTAILFSAASEMGAIISKRAEDRHAIREYGKLLGIIFQIIDDVLDYKADIAKTGKNLGDDFFEGKVTLPIILLMKNLRDENSTDYDKVNRLFFGHGKTIRDLEYITELMYEYKIFAQIDTIIEGIMQDANAQLERIRNVNIKAKELMQRLVGFAAQRNS